MIIFKRYIRPHLAIIGLLMLLVVFLLVQSYIKNTFPLLLIFLTGIIIIYGRTGSHSENRLSVRAFGLTVGLCLGVLGISNYLINPFRLYPTQGVEPLGVLTRTLKMKIYTAASPPPEAVIFGSSRSFNVDTNQITELWHYSALNLSLGSGTIRDDLALLHFILDKGKMPALLIINLSPERFSNFDARVIEPNAPLWNYLDDNTRMSDFQLSINNLMLVFSREQTQASARFLNADLTGTRPHTTWYFDDAGVMRNDTSQPTAEEFDLETLEKFAWTGLFNEGNNPHMETEGMAWFQQILDIAKANHTLVIGYTPPVHPLFKQYLDTHTDFESVRKRINEQVNVLTKDYDFYFTDFMDDAAFSDGQTMFHDKMHPTLETTARMMQILYDQYGQYRPE